MYVGKREESLVDRQGGDGAPAQNEKPCVMWPSESATGV